MNISIKVGHSRDYLRLFNERIGGTRDYRPSLMIGKRTKAARTEATAILYNREFNLLYRRHTAVLFVDRVIVSLIRKLIHRVKLLFIKRERRRIYDDNSVSVALDYALAPKGVVLVAEAERDCVLLFFPPSVGLLYDFAYVAFRRGRGI